MSLKIKPCGVADIELLQIIGRETFDETFRSMNTPETMDSYLSAAFNRDKLLGELQNTASKFYFAYTENDTLVAYLKLNETPAQSDINDPASLEIERLYVSRRFKGKGYGQELMNFALNEAIRLKKQYVWLGVWEKNENALRFYQKMGFITVDKHAFRMGDEIQFDYIMRKELHTDHNK